MIKSQLRHVLLILLILLPTAPAVARNTDSEGVVLAFVAAFNRQDVDAMLTFVVDDIHWYSVGGRWVTTETTGKNQLKEAMQTYFNGIASRSTLLSIYGEGEFVTTMEKSRSLKNLYSKPQCSAATYEIKDNKIKSVWYFPAFECD